MIQTKDSTVYYNIDPTSAVAKISLFKKSARQLYIQNRFSEIIDSVDIQPEKYDLLQKEKTDVFLLYRGWLEIQWQGTLSAIKRQRAGLYNQVGVQHEKSDEGIYSQLNAIAAKIDQLNSPEAKSIEQAVYDTYKNETSEINYIPLLGIAYNLTQTRGQKEYELTNHLGNVLVTVTDKKNGVPSLSNSSLIDHYEPDIVSAQDYYPFGMLQPGRSYLSPNGDKYRYGFNGKENDNEVKGEGNQLDYGMRVYDPRIGKFLSVDPLTKDFPWYTPYQYAGNTPIQAKDLDGEEEYHFTLTYNQNKEPVLTYNKTVTEGWSIFGKYTIPEVTYVIHNDGETYNFSPAHAPGGMDGWNGDYHLDVATFSSFLKDPESFTSVQDFRRGMILRAGAGLVADASGKITGNINLNSGRSIATNNRSRWPEGETTTSTNEQATSANSGNAAAAKANSATGVTNKTTSYGSWGSETYDDFLSFSNFSPARKLLNTALKRQGLTKIPAGFKERWSENGFEYEVRIHAPQGAAPAGSNSRNLTTYRVSRRRQGVNSNGEGFGWEYADDSGNWYHTKDLKSGSNPGAANDTHIPVPSTQ